MDKRHAKRVKYDLQCELVSRSLRYIGSIENIGKDGLCMTIPPTRTSIDIPAGMTFIVKFRRPSGNAVDLQCRVKHSHKTSTRDTTSNVGMEIISKPPDYEDFLKTLK